MDTLNKVAVSLWSAGAAARLPEWRSLLSSKWVHLPVQSGQCGYQEISRQPRQEDPPARTASLGTTGGEHRNIKLLHGSGKLDKQNIFLLRNLLILFSQFWSTVGHISTLHLLPFIHKTVLFKLPHKVDQTSSARPVMSLAVAPPGRDNCTENGSSFELTPR